MNSLGFWLKKFKLSKNIANSSPVSILLGQNVSMLVVKVVVAGLGSTFPSYEFYYIIVIEN